MSLRYPAPLAHGQRIVVTAPSSGVEAATDTTGAAELRDGQALLSTLGALPCPVLVDVDIGHRPPQMVLVNGALASVQWSVTRGGLLTPTLA